MSRKDNGNAQKQQGNEMAGSWDHALKIPYPMKLCAKMPGARAAQLL
jgi:hypothetical protein